VKIVLSFRSVAILFIPRRMETRGARNPGARARERYARCMDRRVADMRDKRGYSLSIFLAVCSSFVLVVSVVLVHLYISPTLLFEVSRDTTWKYSTTNLQNEMHAKHGLFNQVIPANKLMCMSLVITNIFKIRPKRFTAKPFVRT
jgi:hypothetical protein